MAGRTNPSPELGEAAVPNLIAPGEDMGERHASSCEKQLGECGDVLPPDGLHRALSLALSFVSMPKRITSAGCLACKALLPEF